VPGTFFRYADGTHIPLQRVNIGGEEKGAEPLPEPFTAPTEQTREIARLLFQNTVLENRAVRIEEKNRALEHENGKQKDRIEELVKIIDEKQYQINKLNERIADYETFGYAEGPQEEEPAQDVQSGSTGDGY